MASSVIHACQWSFLTQTNIISGKELTETVYRRNMWELELYVIVFSRFNED